jgi:nucleoid-associated protein YgaU
MSNRSISPFERWGGLSPYSDAFLREHVYAAHETLTGLAHRYYNDWRLWRLIADRNTVLDPREIEAGTRLLIPDIPLEFGSFETT